MPANFTVKNIPQELFDKIRARAGRNRRSINGEILSIFEETLTARRLEPDDVLARARVLRNKTAGRVLDQDFIDRAKRRGRP